MIFMYVNNEKSARESLIQAYKSQYNTGWSNFILVIKSGKDLHIVKRGSDKIFMDPDLKEVSAKDAVLLIHNFETERSDALDEEIFSLYSKPILEPNYPNLKAISNKTRNDNIFIFPKKEDRIYYLLGSGMYKSQMLGNEVWLSSSPEKGCLYFDYDVIGEYILETGDVKEEDY